jgi:predicted AlkP superfamily pyrophosphatase or phosphodiesterase
VRTTSWFGIPYPVHIPWRYLPELDVAERRLWNEPAYLDTAATVFDRFRSEGVTYEIVGMQRSGVRGLQAIQQWSPPTVVPELVYLFAGDVDHASHEHGQRSNQVRELLRRVDDTIERQLRAIRMRAGAADLLVWSDHGHHDVRRLDPFDLMARHRVDFRRHMHVIDTNFLRLWVDEGQARREIIERLNATGVGHVLTEEELAFHRVLMQDDRYGNVIFYLDLPFAFDRTIWGFGRRLASAHGYSPDHPGSDGILVSSLPVRPGPFQLADIAPTLLSRLGIVPALDLDGHSILAT